MLQTYESDPVAKPSGGSLAMAPGLCRDISGRAEGYPGFAALSRFAQDR